MLVEDLKSKDAKNDFLDSGCHQPKSFCIDATHFAHVSSSALELRIKLYSFKRYLDAFSRNSSTYFSNSHLINTLNVVIGSVTFLIFSYFHLNHYTKYNTINI